MLKFSKRLHGIGVGVVIVLLMTTVFFAVQWFNDYKTKANLLAFQKREMQTTVENYINIIDYLRQDMKNNLKEGSIEYTEEQDNQARLMFTVSRGELYKLENTTPNEEKIITTLLRNYGGLFTDYHYIDEGFLASQTALQPQQVYQILKGLGQRHILHFIPQKKTPYIRYTQRRED
ncbi:MAG: hypothetical protein J6W60_13690, partial [Treponema sp.]|nr:hypothetical protein [Treponema sp.]